MKLKLKLFLAMMFLFGVIIVLGVMGSYYLRQLARETEDIMKDNYRSLGYMRQIEQLVDEIAFQRLISADMHPENGQFETLDDLINAQLQNITETGEQELSKKLAQSLKKFHVIAHAQNGESDEELLSLVYLIKQHASSIYLINEQTMMLKNEQAAATADKVVLYMSIFASVGILIGFVFIIGLPVYIARPFETFNSAISEIARGNYKISIPEATTDEFGQLANSFNSMAAKLEEYEHTNLAKLIKEQKRLNAVINQLDEVVLGLDENKKIIFANEHCLKLLDLQKHQLIGKYAPDVATNNQLLNSLIKELMVGFLPVEEKSYQPIKIVEENKEKLFAKNVVDVIDKATGVERNTLMGYVVILTDITNFAERDKAKTHFIATLSHELKTPVSAIQMSTDLIRNPKSGGLTSQQVELVQTIEENNERIRRMINEILDISKIESGSIEIRLTEESTEKLINKALEGINIFLVEKQLTLKREIVDIHRMINVDAHKTVWILNNFLTNAIRYAPKGSVIEVSTKLMDQMIEIAVTDQGPGISLSDQKRIFQKFTRLVKSESSGTGLGLAISKEFIEAMGGQIGMHSQEDMGATFWIKCKIR